MKLIRRLGPIVLAATLIGAAAAPTAAAAPPIDVTRGRVITLDPASDLGYSLRGHAAMIRLEHTTFVVVRIKGLDANTTYPAHVHNAPCSSTPPGGSHYQHDVGGAVDDVNEIWPVVTTDNRGRGWGTAWHGHRARSDAQSIVVHYPADTSIRLACVDLS